MNLIKPVTPSHIGILFTADFNVTSVQLSYNGTLATPYKHPSPYKSLGVVDSDEQGLDRRGLGDLSLSWNSKL